MVSGRNQHSPLCSQRFIIGPMPFMTCHCLFNVAFRICHEKIEEMLRQYMLCQQIHPEEKIYIVTQLYDNYISLNQLKKTTCFGTLLQGIFGKSKLSLTRIKIVNAIIFRNLSLEVKIEKFENELIYDNNTIKQGWLIIRAKI